MSSNLFRPVRLVISFLILLATTAAWAQCPASATQPSVNICAPTNGATVASPVTVSATANSTPAATVIQVYVDGVKAYETKAATLSTSLTMTDGTHRVTVQAYNGTWFKSSESITVSSTSTGGGGTTGGGTTGGGTTGGTGSCSPSGTQPSVTLCEPASGATVASPVTVSAAANSSPAATVMQVYVDGIKVYQVSGSTVDTSLNMSAAQHRLTVQAYNGAWFKTTEYITVGSGGTTGGGGTGTGGTGAITAVNHIIYEVQENRSFDHYFGKLNEYRARFGLPASVDGLPSDCSSSNSDWNVPCSAMNKSPDASGYPTTPVYAFHLKSMCIENTSADWIVSHWAFNAGDPSSNTPLMDGFVIGAASAALSTGSSDTKGIRAMGFYTGDDLPYHYWLATQFATSDRWFAPAPTKTEPNRYFLVGATSGGHAYPTGTAIQQSTIFDLLQSAGISWKIYSVSGSTSATAFAGFSSRFANTGHIVPLSQFQTDALGGTLPAVSFIEKPDADEHPGLTNIQYGVNETRNFVNAVMNGPSWKDSVFILTFDEAGGLYDHVPPPTNVPNPDGKAPVDICTSSTDTRCTVAAQSHGSPPYDPAGDFTRYGFRVPVMVISPFTKPHYVSHTVTDSTAILNFIETRFGLPHLNARDAAASDMTEFFDFVNVPWATPPANPPTEPAGTCYDSLP